MSSVVVLGGMYNKNIQLNICTANPTLGYTFNYLWVGSASIHRGINFKVGAF